MLSLVEVRRLMDDPAPPAADPGVYQVLRAVWRTYPLAAAAWRTVISTDVPTAARREDQQERWPLLDVTRIRWDAAALPRQVRRLRRALRCAPPDGPDLVGELRVLLGRGEDDVIALARGFLTEDVGDGRTEPLVGGWVLQPFLYSFARWARTRLGATGRERSRCPVCGGRPCHGYLDTQTGRKVLVCARCLCPWSAPRLECPFCGNTSQELLGYYYDAEAPRRRIDACTACRSILPITLEPETGRSFPLLDHLASMPLRAAVERSTHGDQPS
jgi:hypothetical protein